ncbi:Probable 28S ribosomal protein S16, mitochondrial [Camponotus floridanus]|uniref:Small ribosomal subunit protein bS16m n=1 Tax=Camponotus floridanus TaxID=104421 RepID=E2AAF2_CAMFO|nr:probable 28S ribosomal protein S16, mitochondrial [Camponotus floridanus]EFN69587.1 Probable 28S ribosomal protein S16, mitochondrial [Camponotus floridanus]
MPRLPLHPSSGTSIITPFAKAIRFVRYGCTNRPFYHIIVIDVKKRHKKPPIEQVGTYDPIPNIYNEKLVSFNFERIQYWLTKGAQVSKPVADLLGLAGFLPVHPKTYMRAWRNRIIIKESAKENIFQEQAASKN